MYILYVQINEITVEMEAPRGKPIQIKKKKKSTKATRSKIFFFLLQHLATSIDFTMRNLIAIQHRTMPMTHIISIIVGLVLVYVGCNSHGRCFPLIIFSDKTN